jgi:hypothetical protein
MENGPARVCSSVGAARRWALLGCGLVRTMSRLILSVRTSPLPVPCGELTILSFLGVDPVIGPFWAWKVGPATTVGTSNT